MTPESMLNRFLREPNIPNDIWFDRIYQCIDITLRVCNPHDARSTVRAVRHALWATFSASREGSGSYLSRTCRREDRG